MGPVARRVLAGAYPGKPRDGARPFFNLEFLVERVSGRPAGEFIAVQEDADGQWRVLWYRAVGLGKASGGN